MTTQQAVRGTSVGRGQRGPWTIGTQATAWQTAGKCAQPGTDPDDWFPTGHQGRPADDEVPVSDRYAHNLCDGCPIRNRCLEFAIANGLAHGVYGGRSPRWRKKHGHQWLRMWQERQA